MAIIGIVAAIAIPSYVSFLEKGRRTDAMVFLSEAAGEQFRYFSENNEYAEDFAVLGYPNATMKTEEGHYTVSIDRTDVDKFIMTATPVAGGAQEDDVECGSFIINSSDARYNSVRDANCW